MSKEKIKNVNDVNGGQDFVEICRCDRCGKKVPFVIDFNGENLCPECFKNMNMNQNGKTHK